MLNDSFSIVLNSKKSNSLFIDKSVSYFQLLIYGGTFCIDLAITPYCTKVHFIFSQKTNGLWTVEVTFTLLT